MSHRSIGALLATTLLLALPACSKKEQDASASSSELPAVEDVAISVQSGAGGDEADPIANPAATRGGEITLWGGGYPKSLNRWIDNNTFSGTIMGLMFEGLVGLHPTEDRPVGDLAESWEVSEDGKLFTFKIDPDATWSDGKPVTAADVQFYYDTIMDPKNLTPIFRIGLTRFERPTVIDDKTISILAKEEHWSNFWEAAGLVAFPKHVWEGKDFNSINFEFPVVSGPYELKEAATNRFILLKRRGDWWGRKKSFNVGKFNFDYIRWRAMEDRDKALEALKKGDLDLYAVYTASIWAEKTKFPQVERGWVVRQEVRNREPKGFQGLAMNLRNPVFQDIKVREALSYLLNRETMNEKLMFNTYFLLNSYYPDLFEENKNPDAKFFPYDPSRARALLEEAGYKPNERGVLEKDGKALTFTVLNHSSDTRHITIYLEDLKKVGIQVSLDQISPAGFSKRMDDREYDMAWLAWGAGRLRDPEALWISSAADEQASANVPGVKDEQIDALIQQQKTEMDLGKRNALLKKLDTRLSELIPYVLLWQSDKHRLLYWNKFGTPASVLGKFGREDSAIVYWWLDREKEQALREAMKTNSDLPKPPAEVVWQEP